MSDANSKQKFEEALGLLNEAAKEKKEDSSKRLIDGAIEEGMDAILKHHPKFRGAVEYIEKHIDKKRLAHGISEIQRYIAEKGENWNEEQTEQERIKKFHLVMDVVVLQLKINPVFLSILVHFIRIIITRIR